MSLIELKKVRKEFDLGKITVKGLVGVGLVIVEREFVAIMGPSGSGKSTLMNIIGCLDRPTSGTYKLAGEDISKLPDSRLAKIRLEKIGFIFQTFNLLPKYSAFKNIEVPLIYKGLTQRKRREKVKNLLERVGLADRAAHKPNELSGGQRQRVAIARALANNPSIILADEPTGNLDSKSGHDILKLLTKLNKKEKVTVILVTHEPDVANYAGRIINLKDGQIKSDRAVGKK